VTITEGTNRLVPSSRAGINAAVEEVLRIRREGGFHPGRPEGWDGRASERIVALLDQA
jgi:UDP-N-acetylglucosamine 2-epimerase